MDESEPVIAVRRARKQYSKGGKYVLDDLNMTVKKGIIYGLLGASGCGKTTLLSSIIGTKKLESGTIRVLGRPPGRTAVKSVGYMPQDVALVGEFTVKGALKHYGWIFGMSDKEIEERFEFLSELLDLPPADRLVKNLSGGQQRRVSLAVVLVHNPKLLILDEPTVGLDPVLRQNIWDYLLRITDGEKKTVIITTHYIEEASEAHQIGFMRSGKILEEGQPQMMLAKYNCSTIEDVFVLLSKRQQEGLLCVDNGGPRSPAERVSELVINSVCESKKGLWERLCFTNKGHAKALLSKNFLRFRRHPGTLGFAFLFPLLQITTFFLAIGVTPPDLKIGVVNEELGNYSDCREYEMSNRVGGVADNSSCVYTGLACRFIDSIGDRIPEKIYFASKEEALAAVKQGRIHNLIYFPRNFSQSVTALRELDADDDDDGDGDNNADVDVQYVDIFRDVIDHSLSEVVMKEVFEGYKKYAESLATDCHTNPHAERIPMQFNEPIYGSEDMTYRELVAPGMIAIISVFLAMGVSTTSITMERTEGVWERTIVAGVSAAEILVFHIISLCCVSIFQILELFVVAFNIFQLDCKGDKFIVFLLIYVQSITAICFGIFISVITKSVTDANYASLGLFYPFMTLTGAFWPLEGMPTYLRYLSYFVPLTITNQSLGHVIHKGWGFEHFQVFAGVLASFGFTLFFVLVSASILRRESKE